MHVMAANAEEKMKGMVAIVTGASSGIGAGIAMEYSRQGAQVTISGRKEDKLRAVAQQCEEASSQDCKPLVIIGDVTDEENRKKLIEDTIKKFGRLDVLVNNAGVFKGIPVEMNAGLALLDEMLDLHVRAPYHLSKLALPHLIESKGKIINISSIASSRMCSKVGLEYGVAKAGLDQITKWFAYGLGAKGVRVNSINPACIKTDIMANSGYLENPDCTFDWDTLGPLHALQRVGQVDEVARVAVFLASNDSSFVTGSILPVDGGFLVMPPELETPVEK